MPRRRRLNAPGLPFHITARIQGKVPLLSGLEPFVARCIEEGTAGSAAELVAYAVMPNHLHLILVQQEASLGRVLQPLLRRIAIRVMRFHRCEGHVFERRFRSYVCADAKYFRNALAYVHLNPVRAGLCLQPSEYAWTSEASFRGEQFARCSYRLRLLAERALRVFGTDSDDLEQCRNEYLAFIRWRLRTDEISDSEPGALPALRPGPDFIRGDLYWAEEYMANARAAGTTTVQQKSRPDLSQLARRTIADAGLDMSLELLRSGSRTRPIIAIRQGVIARAILAGYRPCQIANYLRISHTAVSRVGAAIR